MNTLAVAFRATLVTLVVTGIAYPLAVTGLAQVIFPYRANGSIVVDDKGREVGSELIGQGFADPAYVHSRPSNSSYDAADANGNNATNLSTTSKKLREGQPDDPATKDDESFTGVTQLAAAFRADNTLPDGVLVPADAVSRSASGLDPHVSPETALLQADRIARTRGVAVDRVRAVIDEYTEGRELGFLGEPRVNVLAVNLALDRKFGRPAHLAAESGATMPP